MDGGGSGLWRWRGAEPPERLRAAGSARACSIEDSRDARRLCASTSGRSGAPGAVDLGCRSRRGRRHPGHHRRPRPARPRGDLAASAGPARASGSGAAPQGRRQRDVGALPPQSGPPRAAPHALPCSRNSPRPQESARSSNGFSSASGIRHCLEAPLYNATVAGYEVDVFWPEQRLIVELDSYTYHHTPPDFEADRARDAKLMLLRGYLVLRITDRQLDAGPRRGRSRRSSLMLEGALRPPAGGRSGRGRLSGGGPALRA